MKMKPWIKAIDCVNAPFVFPFSGVLSFPSFLVNELLRGFN